MSQNKHTYSLRRTAALLCAAFAGLSLGGPLRAQSPVGDPNPSPAVPTPYSSPLFHSGGEFTPPLFALPLPVPFPDPLYGQLQGTPTGLVPGTGVNAGTYVSTELASFLLGNYLPTSPPAGPTVFFPNHTRDGTVSSWSAPLTFITANAVAPATSPTGASPLINVESTPTAVNVSEFPFIQNVQYIGTTPGSIAAADPTLYLGSTTPGLHSGSAPAGSPYLIRQLVYFGRAENRATTNAAGVAINTPVGAIYCVDGLTGEVVWRFQVPSVVDPVTGATLRDPSVFAAPAVAYMNVLTDSVAGTYANKAVVVVTANDGFVYCLDATGNGDGTSNVAATTGGDVNGNGGTPIYGAQPTYPTTVSATAGPHVGTTSVYWIYRPDPAQPNPSTSSSINFDPQTVLPVPASFGLASPNIYVERGISTVPNAAGKLASNAIVYVGNTRDCVYALDGLGAVNNLSSTTGPLPAYNASLAASVTNILDLVPTCNPRWWFTPDNASNNGLSFESTPAIAPPSAPYPAAVVVTASANPVAIGATVTFTATVSDGTGGGGQPTGTVTFTVDGVAQAPAAILTGGVAASAPVTFTTGGPHTVTAAYSGDGTFSANTNAPAFDEEVESGAVGSTSTVITSTPNPSALNQPVAFSATVTEGAAGLPVTGGTVTFTVGGVAQPPVPVAAGTATLPATALSTTGAVTISAAYTPIVPYTASSTSFQQYVFGPLGPTVYIGSSQELGIGSNAGRLYAIDGFNGPKLAGVAGGTGHVFDQRPKWAYPNLYAAGPGQTGTLKLRPALGNLTGSPVVFTNTDDVVTPATATTLAVYRTRIYFAANTGLEVPTTTPPSTQPNPRPAVDTTGRVWAVNPDGSTAFTGTGVGATVWSYPQANNPNDPAFDNTAEPSPPIGAFLHSTPAMGFVQFPATIQYGTTPYTDYPHMDTVHTTSLQGNSVPMLYIGTAGAADLGLYALDVDGSNDAQRGVYRLESPTGSTFESSPVLVVNSSTTGGNGGAVYATSGNSLLQVTATPISNVNSAQSFAFVGVDATFSGGGPISGPAVAAADTSDLQGTATTIVGGVPVTTPSPFNLYGGKNATDFVYFGDGTLGFCRGITPIDPGYGGVVSPVTYGSTTDTNPTRQYSNKFFLQAYLFTEATKTNTDMGTALGLNNPITGFEWGGFSYIRIGNVIPPCSAADAAAPTSSEVVADPTDPTLFYGNGQAVTFSIGNASVSVLPTNQSGGVNTQTGLTGVYPESTFVHRSDLPKAGTTPASPGTDPSTQLVTPAGSTGAGLGWIAAYSYPIGSDQTRIGDTPGAFRRVRQATQTATIYTQDAAGNFVSTGQTISLDMQTGIGSQYAATDAATGTKTIKQTPPMEQPTFGILNPLAVQGLGVPLNVSGSPTPPSAAVAVTDSYGAGPFGSVATAPIINGVNEGYAGFVNGSNRIPSLPNSGYDVTKENPTAVDQFVTDQAAFTQIPITIATSVGDILDGTTGTNAAPITNAAYPALNPDNIPNTYGLVVENRSLVGTYAPPPGGINPFQPIPVAMQSVAAHWNDNTDSTTFPAGPPQNEPGGPGAIINPLPWEDFNSLSSINANASLDYPDIPASAITHTLIKGGTQSLNLGDGTATLRGTTGPPTQPAYHADYVDISVTVPQHQPANLQAWDGTAKIPVSPSSIVPANNNFPHGYIEGSGTGAGNSIGGGTPQRVFVDLSGRGQYNTIYPYRDVQSFAGVPVNMKTTTQTTTVNLENAPSALGLQTEGSLLGFFDPYNSVYQPFFKPVGVYNDGNVNLLNIHFDQQMHSTAAGNQTLTAVSDGNDLLSQFGGFDFLGTSGPVNSVSATTFERTTMLGVAQNLTGSVHEQSFLFRTSLDTDLMQAFGRNPVIAGNATLNALYPSGTFHKPRAGSIEPTTLTVPDKPEGGDPIYSVAASAPYVGIALPFGTPVGTYHTLDTVPLRVFEGYDTPPNPTAAQLIAREFYPPTYGTSVGGHQATASASMTNLLPLGANNQALVPVSSDGLKLQITVQEDRLTDGFTPGALPMVDTGPAIPASGAIAALSSPDFAPAAFRDAASGNLSVYWTSGRGAGYDIYGANVPFATNNLGSYFHPTDATKDWWGSIGGYSATAPYPLLPLGSLALGTNSSLSVVPGSKYVLAVHVAPGTAYNNTLYSYEITPATGAIVAGTAPKPITQQSDRSQVKYGIKGVLTPYPNPVWAFWTASTRGRTGLYYNAQNGLGFWEETIKPLPIPAGLTAVSDASPIVMTAPVSGGFAPVLEVTYSGTGPDGNADLYVSRYQPQATTGFAAQQLNLVPFPAVTENLNQANGWYQGRDVAWSRTGALNVSVPVPDPVASTSTTSLLYNPVTGAPKFTKAIYDKASGFLVLTGVKVPNINNTGAPTTNTVTVDAATGRVRFTPALLPATQTFAPIQATFSPLARRLTVDSRADTAPVTFLDTAPKVNDAPGIDTSGNPVFPNVEADRRWTIWRKAGIAGIPNSATLYYKTQRLTLFLPSAIGLSNPALPATPTPLLTSVTLNGSDVSKQVDVDYARGRLYFPISLGAEGQPVVVKYTDTAGIARTTVSDIVQWEDEFLANDTTDVPPTSTAAGLDAVIDTKVPITPAVNENNPAAFLDPMAGQINANGLMNPHKVWLFWNSTRNGTADIYSETIDPQFEPRPLTP